MNETEAAARIDELFDGVAEIAREGRCRHCEAIPSEEPAADKLMFLPTADAAPEHLKILGVSHAEACPLHGADAEIQELVDRFALAIEPVFVDAPPRGVFVSGSRIDRRAVVTEGPDGSARATPLLGDVCDICGSGGAQWRYPCQDFPSPTGFTSQGPWDVCDRCRDLIESSNIGEMTRLAAVPHLARLASVSKAKRASFYRTMTEHFREFMNHRTGPAERIEP